MSKAVAGASRRKKPVQKKQAPRQRTKAKTSASSTHPADRLVEAASERLVANRDNRLDFDALSDDQLTEQIARLMFDCAQERKVKPQDLVWLDFREWAGYAFGKSWTGLKPKHLTRIGGFNTLRDAIFPPAETAYGVERQRLRERANSNRAESRSANREAMFLERINDILERRQVGRINPTGFSKLTPKPQKVIQSAGFLGSDMHFGARLDALEVMVGYGPHEAARRLASVALQLVDQFSPAERARMHLDLFIAGDNIQGKLHDPHDGTREADQFSEALHLLEQFIAFVASCFASVKVHCTPGNHGRLTSRHHGRATFEKWDALETMLHVALAKAALRLKNVTFNIPKRAFIDYEVFGMKGRVTHGDTVYNPGYPGTSVNVKGMTALVNDANVMLAKEDRIQLMAIGHVHFGVHTRLKNNCHLLTNPALVPADSYPQSFGSHYCPSGQTMWVSEPGKIVKSHHFLWVDEDTDRDSSLEKVIQPYKGFWIS